MTYRVVTSHLIGGTTWGYLPDEMPEYPTAVAAIIAKNSLALALLTTITDDSFCYTAASPGDATITWNADGYFRGRRFEVVEDA